MSTIAHFVRNDSLAPACTPAALMAATLPWVPSGKSIVVRCRERFRLHDAVRDTLGGSIISVFSARVNHRKVRINFSGMFGDLPAVSLARPQIDVCNECPVFSCGSIKQCDGILTGRGYDGLKSTVGKALLDQALNKLVIFDDQNALSLERWSSGRLGQRDRMQVPPLASDEVTASVCPHAGAVIPFATSIK
jgi:hypothetical protein